MRLTHVVPIAVLVGLTACTTADILRLDSTPRPETSPQSIELIGQEPTRPYAVIAIVSAQGEATSLAKVQERLVREAAKLGGHAILFETASLTRIGDHDTERQQISGKVIVFTDSTGSN